MSIATLKKRYYASHNLSHNSPYGFSLNSSRRLEGHHQEPQIQTPFKGNAPRGYGLPIMNKTVNRSQRVNIDPFNKPRPSIKSNAALISKMMWKKPVVKIVGANNYDNIYATIQSNVDNGKECKLNSTGGKCTVGYTKNVSPSPYSLYNKTTLLKNNCIPTIHLPIAGNGLPCGNIY